MHLNPDDARRLGLADGETARVTSRVGKLDAAGRGDRRDHARRGQHPARLGPRRPGPEMRVAAAHAGVNSNLLADEDAIDPLSGNGVLNGIPVTIERASPA